MRISGDKETIARLLSLKSETFRRVVTAVEKSAVRMSNHARAGHEHGSDPHSRGRFETQTGNLVASISPGGTSGQAMQFERIDEDMVVGLFGVLESGPSSVMQYAPVIEELYPFVWPAVVANIERFAQEIAKAAPGATGGAK